MSVSIRKPGGNKARKPCPCVGIEFQPLGFTQLGELVRVYVYSDNPDASVLKSLAAALCSQEPLIVGPMEFITILKHSPELVKGLGPVPRHADNLRGH